MKTKNVLIFLDGEQPTRVVAEHFVSLADLIIATDGAARYVRELGFIPNLVIGDLDSIDDDTKSYYESVNVPVIFEATQYSTDFEKSLDYIIEHDDNVVIIVLGIHGKRTDHLMTNFSVLLRYSRKLSIKAYDATHEHYFLTDGNNSTLIIGKPEKTKISLTPMPKATGVVTEGLFYPIADEEMTFGEREGLSNIIVAPEAKVSIAMGALLVSIPHGLDE